MGDDSDHPADRRDRPIKQGQTGFDIKNLGAKAVRVAAPVKPGREPPVQFADPPRFFLFCPIDVRVAGGGVPALLLAGIRFWTSPAKDDWPRSRPQPDLERPAWMHGGARHLARELGLTAGTPRAAAKQVTRAIAKLLHISIAGRPLIELVDPDEIRDGDWTAGIRPCPTCVQHRARFQIKVYTNLISEWGLSVNSALLLAYLFQRCVQRKSKLQIKRDGHLWFAKDVHELTAETGLVGDQIRTALQHLRTGQHVMWRNMLFSGRQTRHFQITPETEAAITELIRQGQEL